MTDIDKLIHLSRALESLTHALAGIAALVDTHEEQIKTALAKSVDAVIAAGENQSNILDAHERRLQALESPNPQPTEPLSPVLISDDRYSP